MQFHPNSLYLATGSSDWTARLWDVQRGSCIRVFIGHQGIVSTLAFSPDGRYLATAGESIFLTDSTFQLFDLLLAFTCTGEDLAISIWDLGSGKRIKKMTGHRASIYSLAWSGESTVLASGSADWTVRCWDVNGSGGLPAKARENGAHVNGFGATSGADINGIGKEEESIET